MTHDALSPAQPLTLDDTTPTLPEGSVNATRYFGLIHGANLTTTPDRPFVLATLEEAHTLLAAAYHGGPVHIREWISGTVVESDTRFIGSDQPEMVLYRREEPPPHFDWEYPDLLVKVGPRGGIHHERP